ncbi:hypothetical protein [Kitasatospora cineracea]|uniref:hypothetical protein n=1 Tax=Kitasatospora cineracea TaxID=88074 RepID=UPI0037F2FFC9
MTADRVPGPTVRRLLALPAVLAVVLGAGACSGGSDRGGSGGALSYPKVRSAAERIGPAGGDGCPFGLDLGAALKAAGVDRAAAPGAPDGRPVEAEAGDGYGPQPWPSGLTPAPTAASAPGLPATAWITCRWTVGGEPVRLDLLAVPLSDAGTSLLLPTLQRTARLSVADLTTVVARRPEPGGAPLLTPGGGLAALARVAAAGDGDIVLLLSSDTADGSDNAPALSGEPLGRTLERLTAQLPA